MSFLKPGDTYASLNREAAGMDRAAVIDKNIESECESIYLYLNACHDRLTRLIDRNPNDPNVSDLLNARSAIKSARLRVDTFIPRKPMVERMPTKENK